MVFRDGAEVELGSRNEKPLTRYFPELVDALLANLPAALRPRRRDRDRRRHRPRLRRPLAAHPPAESRVQLLAAATPASFVAFDLLALGDEDLRAGALRLDGAPRLERRCPGPRPPVHLTPATDRPRRGPGLVLALRGRRPRRRRGQAAGPRYRARQARDVQGQARAHGRLRRGRVPLAQGRPDGVGSLAARPVRRARGACTTSASRPVPVARRASSWTSSPRYRSSDA